MGDGTVGVFVQDLNPMTGRNEWTVMAGDYDYQQEVARAGFADMLHDSERVRTPWRDLNLFFNLGFSRTAFTTTA